MSASRRGSAYLLVLGASMLIVTVGVSAVMISKQRTAAAILRSEAMRARAGALAGMSMALELADDDVTWRSAHVDAPKCFVSSLDGVSIRVLASDPSDGVLDDDWTDPVLLRSVANIGGGARTYEASFKPVIRRVESLNHALSATGDIMIKADHFDALGSIEAGGVIRVRSEDVRATTWISQDATQGLDPREVTIRANKAPEPPSLDAIAVLRDQAVEITSRDLHNAVLSDGVNPWGSPSRSGVYMIDCRGGGARIANARVRATLVFVNAPRGVRIEDSVSIESGNPEFPALVVDGPCFFQCSSADLSETALGVNFNPVGAPFDGGTDNDRRDSYGSMINGMIWIRGDVMIQGEGFVLDGSMVVDGDVSLEATTQLRHTGTHTTLRGFAVRESWRRIDGTFARVTE